MERVATQDTFSGSNFNCSPEETKEAGFIKSGIAFTVLNSVCFMQRKDSG